MDAGAIVIGKTNMDQFATGLTGTRSPYGVVPNSFDERYIGGGSSSGSASVVARGLVPFALGTDTAGSGRVPAGLNNIVGLKPTRGRLSMTGVVPACRSLDCVSVFALTVEDAERVCELGSAFDPADAYSRATPEPLPLEMIGDDACYAVPAAPEFHGDTAQAAAWDAALEILRSRGLRLEARDLAPLDEVAALLYGGPWVAERYAAIQSFIENHAASMHAVVRDIVLGGAAYTAADAFRGQYRLAALKRQVDATLAGCDALLVPTVPRHLLIDDVLAEPVRLNAELGKYTNFVNLLDWCALALPAGMRADGLPFGITLVAPQWREPALCREGRRWQRWFPGRLGATSLPVPGLDHDTAKPAPPAAANTGGHVDLAVVGAHLAGMPLNHQLGDRGAVRVSVTTTSANYRLFALPDTAPPKPGLARARNGACIEVEVWRLTVEAFGSFVAEVPPPLGIDSVELADGGWVKGFICEGAALDGAADITHYGGWRAYLAARDTEQH